jgi:cytochrome b subunit of formate dehydrogenase
MSMMKNRIKRFTPIQRLFHSLLMISFLILGATGLSRLYILSDWGKWLTGVFGGYESALVVHKYTGFFMIAGFIIHTVYLLTKTNSKNFIGPDSLLPKGKDLTDFLSHIGWFLGLRESPQFDRWGYWEKFDYWAVFWGMAIIGVTGLMMAFPLIATQYMPGWGLNVALWVHRIEALLAMAHVFIIHFFIAHLRRHNFPMDRTMFEGSADLEAVQVEKPSWINRLKSSGEYEDMLVAEAQSSQKAIFFIFGYVMVAIGLLLLIGALVNWQSIAW